MALTSGGSEWYREYYERKGHERNDLLRNPGVLFQALARDAAVVRAIQATGIDPERSELLDVGCGSGSNLVSLTRLGFPLCHLHGIESREDLVSEAKTNFGALDISCHDARAMPFESGRFPVVIESTMFSSIADDDIARAIAGEMMRVTAPDGYIILVDWRVSNPLRRSEASLGRARVRRLFPRASFIRTERGALAPPIGRYLSRTAPWLYFLVQSALPFTASQVAYVLRVKS